MLKYNNAVTAMLMAATIYLLFVAGGVIPLTVDDLNKSIVKGGMLFVVMLMILNSKNQRGTFVPLCTFFLIGLVIVSFGMIRSTNLLFSIEKLDGAVICSVFLAYFLNAAFTRFGDEYFMRIFLFFSIFILALTVVYKIKFGFFDRDVRFFLNGPIVYGWIMSLCAIMSFHLIVNKKKLIFVFLFVVFVIALIWTESKGSLIAFVFAWSFYCSTLIRKHTKAILSILFIFFCFIMVYLDFILETLDSSRFSAIGRLISGEINETDEGSLGARSTLFDVAVNQFLENPILGIGLGQFRFNEFNYPHNQHLELFAELGAVVGMLHIGFVAFSFIKSNTISRSIILLFVVGACFSGDSSYLRFIYAFCLLSIIKGLTHQGHHIKTVYNHRLKKVVVIGQEIGLLTSSSQEK